MIDDFLQLISAHQGEVAIQITSAKPLDKSTISRLESSLKQSQFASSSDVQKVKFEYRVNPSIQGGLEVHFGDRTVDLSVSSRVNKLNALLRGMSKPLTDRVDLDISSRDSSLDFLAIHLLRTCVIALHNVPHCAIHSTQHRACLAPDASDAAAIEASTCQHGGLARVQG